MRLANSYLNHHVDMFFNCLTVRRGCHTWRPICKHRTIRCWWNRRASRWTLSKIYDIYWSLVSCHINPFHATKLLSIPSATIRKPEFFNVFRGYRKRPLAWNGQTHFVLTIPVVSYCEIKYWNKRGHLIGLTENLTAPFA